MPPIRGYLPIVGKSLLVADCVVADAVAVEPVSTPKFPANREKNREFCKLVAFSAAETPNRAVVAALLMQISYSMEQGII
jgi:hypothetical protein